MTINMTLLATGQNISICAYPQDIKRGEQRFFVMKGTNIYNPRNRFRNINANTRPLSELAIKEYESLVHDAEESWETIRMRETHAKHSEMEDLGTTLERLFADAIADKSANAIFELTMPKVRERIIKEFGILPQTHEIKTPASTRTIKGITHEKYETVLDLVYNDIPVFLTGAAGTGKNVICKQVAESLGLDFYFTNAVTQEYKLTGFIDANGTYHETQFYKAFKNGGLFFLDEMDGSIPEVLILLNAAIANRYFDFPNEKVEANENFRVIAAGNTFGTGADIEYSGRYQLDAASLDRFALVSVDYSPKIEMAISGGDEELCNFIHNFRKATSKAGLRHLATYRSIERINKAKDFLGIGESLKIALLKNMTKDDMNIILKEMENQGENQYYLAFVNITKEV